MRVGAWGLITAGCVFGTFILLSISRAWPQTIGQFSASFVEGVDKECRVAQRAAPQNHNMPDGQLAQYCNCVARHSVEKITMDEVFALQKTGQRPQSMQRKLNAIGQACADVLMGRATDTPAR